MDFNIENTTQCFFAPWTASSEKCNYCCLTGVIFTTAYLFTYVFGAKMMKIASANSFAVIAALAPSFTIFFWLIFTGLNRWAGGSVYSKLEIICYIFSIAIIGIGVIMYRKAEKKKMANDYAKLESNTSNDEVLINSQTEKTENDETTSNI